MSSTQHQLIEQCATRLRGIVEALDNIHDNTPHRWSADLDDVHSSAESLLALINDQASPPCIDCKGTGFCNSISGEEIRCPCHAPIQFADPAQAPVEQFEQAPPSEDQLTAAGLSYPLAKEDAVNLWYAGFRSEVVTVLEAWEAIGHDIGMNPSKGELLDSLRNIAAICNAHGNDMPAQSAIDQRQAIADAITGALAFGAQASRPPPADHWLRPFYDIGRAEGQRTQELAMLVRMLASSLKRHAPESNLVARATNYLAAKGLAGTPLRDSPASVEQAGGDERAAFEAAFAAMGRPVCRADYDQDAYGNPFDDGGWTGWQARAALARVAELEGQEPVAYRIEARDERGIVRRDCLSRTPFNEGLPDARRWAGNFTVTSTPLYAALARVAELEAKLAELEKQEPVARIAFYEGSNTPVLVGWAHMAVGQHSLYATPVAQAQHSVPEEFIGRLSEFLAQRGTTGKALLRELRAMLAAAPGKEVPQAWLDVQAERRRQVEAEGWTPEHDDEHACDEIAAFACFYAMPPAARDWDTSSTGYGDTLGEAILPEGWEPKTGDRRRELVKACALALAEIERLDRAGITQSPQPGATTASS
ncbi:hypothetical protein [Pseudomonas aeruginosa]|uniref:hypothetical protein n=1 Tax=Pseudomonas aeruginosa TaxID=287 RepID=UPI003CC5F97D